MSKTTKMIAALGIVAGLGVAAMPFGAFAAEPYDQNDNLNTPKDDTATVTFSAVVDPVVSIRVDADTQTIASIAPHAKDESKTTVATISTNDEGGWKLYAKDANGGTLNKAADTGAGVSAKTIDAYTDTLAAGTSAFGYKVSATARGASSESEGTITNAKEAYSAFTGGDVLIASANKRAADDTVTVTYGVSTADDQAAGTYTDTITYTAHTNTL